MNPLASAVLTFVLTAGAALVVFAIKHKGKESAEDVFKNQIVGALAIWEADFRRRIKNEGGIPFELSARDYMNLADALSRHLDGHLRELIEVQTRPLHDRISRLRDEVDVKLARIEDRLNDKQDK